MDSIDFSKEKNKLNYLQNLLTELFSRIEKVDENLASLETRLEAFESAKEDFDDDDDDDFLNCIG